ncbi:hypothetical protein EIP91_002003 [Steccherinum ochraceum]|uniref:PCI domain-containing protein n=1 Tax=Steccherinum ochraceum TaxID=92696 RepID=A0A4R0RJ85_9APHY|nr:hypothetical protein EIP91_002003 [Steccherinum ochraceum]
MSEDIVLPYPNLELAQYYFILSSPSLSHLHENARTELLKGIQADQMAPYYRIVTSTSALPSDAALLETMEKANAEELEKFAERLAEAEKTEGESDIADALRARASYLTRIGDKEKAVEAQKVALEKTSGLGQRIDIVLTLIRIGLFFNDQDIIAENLAKAESLVDEGGDWDRRNRLKVYRGLHLLSIRQFKTGAELLLDALSTFTATELLSYNDFVALTTIANALVLKRVDLKKKLIGAPEVNQVLPEMPLLADLIHNLYEIKYDKFFIALATLEQTFLLPSRILAPHTRYYVREMRIIAYSQILESYRSLTLDSLARSFGVSIEFVDNELSRFIASGRLHCTIDKVHGIVETNRPALKNAQTLCGGSGSGFKLTKPDSEHPCPRQEVTIEAFIQLLFDGPACTSFAYLVKKLTLQSDNLLYALSTDEIGIIVASLPALEELRLHRLSLQSFVGSVGLPLWSPLRNLKYLGLDRISVKGADSPVVPTSSMSQHSDTLSSGGTLAELLRLFLSIDVFDIVDTRLVDDWPGRYSNRRDRAEDAMSTIPSWFRIREVRTNPNPESHKSSGSPSTHEEILALLTASPALNDIHVLDISDHLRIYRRFIPLMGSTLRILHLTLGRTCKEGWKKDIEAVSFCKSLDMLRVTILIGTRKAESARPLDITLGILGVIWSIPRCLQQFEVIFRYAHRCYDSARYYTDRLDWTAVDSLLISKVNLTRVVLNVEEEKDLGDASKDSGSDAQFGREFCKSVKMRMPGLVAKEMITFVPLDPQ